MDGLKKDRTIFVRKPADGERNANLELIEKGAKAVDFEGNEIVDSEAEQSARKLKHAAKKESFAKVLVLLESNELTPKQILEKVPLNISHNELTKELKSIPNIRVIYKSNKMHYSLKQELPSLFAD